MTHRARPRVHFVTGGPTWDERHSAPKGQPRRTKKRFTKKQKAARRQLVEVMDELGAAVRRRDWRAARAARSAAWVEVKGLADDLTRDERQELGKYKQQILAGEDRDRRR